MPFSPLKFLIFFLAVAFLVGFVQVGLISIAFDKLGLSPESAYLLLMCTLIGSVVNLPLLTLKADGDVQTRSPAEQSPVTGKILVAANVGGAVVPVAFSIYLINHNPLGLFHVAIVVALVAIIAHKFSQPIPGVGIGIPLLITPIAAALIATIVDPQQRAPLAYIGGTLGVVIGADLIRLKDIRKLGVQFASIGGAGTFDGVSLTGFIAVLLA